jgi:hypothetical protein
MFPMRSRGAAVKTALFDAGDGDVQRNPVKEYIQISSG